MFAKVAVPRPLQDWYEYSYHPGEIGLVQAGDLVEVPFGRSKLIGCVIEASLETTSVGGKFEIRPIHKKLGMPYQLPVDLIELCKFAGKYYASPLGEAFQIAFPPGNFKEPKQRRTNADVTFKEKDSTTRTIVLNEEQESALQTMLENPRGLYLLEGVTGSGKTEVYIELAKKALEKEKSVLILVPEIALTTQLKDRFEGSLGVPVAMWHSAVSDGVRHSQWKSVRSGQTKVVVGARSAVFSPIKDLGLVVVDEEHDSSYKQEDRFRYHARDLAIFRAHKAGAMCVLGSATPSLETSLKVNENKIVRINLIKKFHGTAEPKIEVVSLAGGDPENKSSLHPESVKAIQEAIEKNEQVMIYLNRRGYSQFIICRDCGWVKKCRQCSVSLTLYRRKNTLLCHWCGEKQIVPDACEDCHSHEVQGMGSGTESLEEELAQCVVGARISRLDRDQITSQKRLESTLKDFRDEKSNILLGTQMMVKGHDFPKVTLVVVIQADMLFRWPDFRSSERAVQTLIQVAGRAGRAQLPGRVIIQAYDVDHPVLKVVLGEMSWSQFVKEELEIRKELNYPPYSRMVRYRFSGKNTAILGRKAEVVMDQCKLSLENEERDRVMGPSEALMPLVQGVHRIDAYFKAKAVQDAAQFTQRVKKMAQEQEIDLVVDVDPYGN